MKKTNTTPGTTTNAQSTEAAKVAAVPEAMPARQAVRIEESTLTEHLADVDGGEIMVPTFQRGAAWNEKVLAQFAADLCSGLAIPPLVLAELPDGNRLLVDGCQRTAGMEYALKEYIKGDKYRAYVEDTPIQYQVVSCDTYPEAARLFRRYNNGARLSGAEKGKSELPEAAQKTINAISRELRSMDTGKWGKAGPDTLAAMLFAAALDPAKASSSSATAIKVLATAKAEKLMAIPDAVSQALDAMKALFKRESDQQKAFADAKKKAIEESKQAPAQTEYLPACVSNDTKDKTVKGFWGSGSRFVPLVSAIVAMEDKAPTADEWATILWAYRPAPGGAFADTSNAKKATAKRANAIKRAVKTYRDALTKEATAPQTVAEQTEEQYEDEQDGAVLAAAAKAAGMDTETTEA